MTKTKTALTFSPIALATILATAVAVWPTNFDGNITSTQEAQVGELVVIEASEASSYKWQVLPDNYNYKLINDGQTLIFSAQEPGEYLFFCAMAKGSKVELAVHRVIITPYAPDVKKVIRRWLPATFNKETAHKLAYAFDNVINSNPQNVSELILKSAESNRIALGEDLSLWKPFLVKLSNYCQKNLSGRSLEEHIELWKEVSETLKGV